MHVCVFFQSGNNLSGFASQFANRIWGTAKQLRNAERKSANRKNQRRNGATAHCICKSRSPGSWSDCPPNNPRPRLLRRRWQRPGSRLTQCACWLRLIKTSSGTVSELLSFNKNERDNNLIRKFKKEIVFASLENKWFSWCDCEHARTFISRTAGCNVSLFPSPLCMCPASGFSLTSRPGQGRCLSRSKYGDRLRATSTSFLQGVRELQWNKDTLVKTYEADMHKRPLLMSSSRWETVNEKKFEEHDTPL